MIFFELLQKNCANFPLISSAELGKLKNQLTELISKAKRSCQIPQSQKSTEDLELAVLLPTLEHLHQLQPNKDHYHLVEILLDDEFNQSPHIIYCNSMIWKNIFKHFIFLIEPLNNLQFIKQYDTLFFHPSQFAGLMSALLEYGYTSKTIIDSGMMQKFFKFHINSAQTIEDTYETLEKHSDNGLVHDFLIMARHTPCGMEVFAKTNIIGTALEAAELAQEPIEAPIQANLIISEEQFLRLFSWLKSDFLVIFLSQHPHQNEQFINLLTPWFVQQPLSEIKALYQNIFYILPEHESFQIFRAIGKALSTPIIRDLVTSPSKWFWIALATTTKGAVPISKKQILELALQQVIEPKDILYIHELCHKPQFKPLYEHFYQNIFELFTSHADLDLDDVVFHSLKLYPKTKYWSLKLAHQLKTKLSQTIQSNLDGFDHDHFLNIRDVFLNQNSTYKKLKLFNFEFESYPDEHYQLTSLVLSYLYMNSENRDAFEWAKHMLPGRLQFEESQIEALSIVKRILKEWIKHSSSYPIMMYACVVLKKHFQISINQLEHLLPTANNLAQIALYNNDCLEYYFQLFPDEKLSDILTYSSQIDNEPLIIKMLEYPKTFFNLLKKLNPKDCYQILNFRYKHQAAIFYQLFAQPKLLRYCLSLIYPQQRQNLFDIIHPSDESNIYYYAVKYPKTLSLLLSYFDYQDFLRGILQVTLIHDNAFELAFENSDSFALIINTLENKDLMQLCQTCSKHSSEQYLDSILKQPELLKILVEKLPAVSIAELLMQNMDSLLNTSIHKPEIWQMILSRLPSDLSFSLLASSTGTQPLIHHICKYPASMEAVLMQLPMHMRLNLLKLENHRKQSVVASFNKPIYPSLSIILDLLPSEDLITFAQLPFHDPRIILDLLVSHIPIFHKFYTYLPKAIQHDFLLHVTANQERVIDQISLNETALIQEIFSNLNDDAIYQTITAKQAKLLIKSLHHPETLQYFLKFIDKIELLELLFGQHEAYCPALFKISQTQTVVTLIQSALAIDHQAILMHKHQQAGSILQFCINEPNEFLTILGQCSMDTLDWMSQKIISHSLSLKPLLEKPSLFAKMLQYLPEPKRKPCLDAICLQYPQFNLSIKLKSMLSEFIFAKPKACVFFQAKQANPCVHPRLKSCHVLSDILAIKLNEKKQDEMLPNFKP